MHHSQRLGEVQAFQLGSARILVDSEMCSVTQDCGVDGGFCDEERRGGTGLVRQWAMTLYQGSESATGEGGRTGVLQLHEP